MIQKKFHNELHKVGTIITLKLSLIKLHLIIIAIVDLVVHGDEYVEFQPIQEHGMKFLL